jgi:hypothetical protein
MMLQALIAPPSNNWRSMMLPSLNYSQYRN